MRKVKGVVFWSICTLLFLTSCSERREYREMLSRAEVVMDEHPDSALTILDSLGQHQADFGKSFLMRYRLHRLNALNKVDSVFRSADEAKALANYFEDHGTPNEQMLANYLLGRAYYDIHEAPMALNSFQQAAERADTTAKDCNYRQLSRVYGQMASIFYQQNLMKNSLRCDDQSIRYGWLGKDTLCTLRSMAGKIGTYRMMMKTDSAIYIWEEVTNLLNKYGYKQYAASYAIAVLRNLIDRGEIEKARRLINTYESETGFFDLEHNIEKGREIYYYSKGYYYLAINKVDSAEYYFRKELREGKDFNNQNSGSRGLALLYKKIHQPDSAAKYALYSYEMNDSMYAQMATTEVERIQSMFDYTRNQEIAQQEKERAAKEHNKAINISLIFFIFVIIVAYVFREVYKKRNKEQKDYKEKISMLAKIQADVITLRSHGQELSQMLIDKEKESADLIKELEDYKARLGQQKDLSNEQLQNSEIYKQLEKSADKALKLSNEDWHQIYMMVIDILPNFYKLISSKKNQLNDNEFKTCILIRLNFSPKDVSNFLDVTQPYITKVCKSLMNKLFGEEGKSKDLEARLNSYS